MEGLFVHRIIIAFNKNKKHDTFVSSTLELMKGIQNHLGECNEVLGKTKNLYF